ncbi:hypothetical protein GUITHDRAFT_120886 [Guillardia theta CCMP2712]|uniref:ApaG domain-containing protein n=1 Tax=Guillardia theta (strain CCMP2712) TaxID=905079 RepID=L1IAR3_GUITC|nr:hypothetical protein GUITHDRAFT_120886 [Guillardia theta CCMP2712]EKX32935.1 hypothetical protein GUITHDRAFT_120886 [Guillardia theta CCMP2712]|eukprot:XP_005819915.1 hypothetical protein GUITHDRAFT_120886 [Guillardia theta CCMP2712]
MLKEIRGLTMNETKLYLHEKPLLNRWGHGQFVYNSSQVDALLKMLPPRVCTQAVDWSMTRRKELLPLPEECSDGFSRAQLFKITRELFKKSKEAEEEKAVEAEDDAFTVLKLLTEQHQLQLSSRITIDNESEQTVQLIGRQWEILDETGAISGSVPKGTHGVVGMTPVLKPGQRFEYHSGVELTTKEGRMSGSFQMAVVGEEQEGDSDNGDDELFDAIVAPFALRSN